MGKEHKITVLNQPLDFSVDEKLNIFEAKITNMELYFTVGTCLPFLGSSFIMPIITDRTSHMKTMFHISGISIWMYWTVNFVWDYLSYIIISTIFCLPMFFMKTVLGFTIVEFCLMLFVVIFFGMYALPLVYCLSIFFENEYVGYFTAATFSVFTGTYSYLMYIGLFKQYKTFAVISHFVPQFSIMQAIRNIHLKGLEYYYCRKESLYLGVVDEKYLCIHSEDICCSKYFF